MSSSRIRFEYESLSSIAALWSRESDAVGATLRNLKQCADVLANGDWLGQGANAFQAEMAGAVFPSLARLVSALGEASRATVQIRDAAQVMEEEAAAVLRGTGTGTESVTGSSTKLATGAVLMSDPGGDGVRGGDQPEHRRYHPAWEKTARLFVVSSPMMPSKDIETFEKALRSTPFGAELLAKDPDLLKKVDIHVYKPPLASVNGGISFPADMTDGMDDRYVIGIPEGYDMSKPEYVGLLAHELMHAYQREHAIYPDRRFDFTDVAMEREAYTFGDAVQLDLIGRQGDSAPRWLEVELVNLTKNESTATAAVFARDVAGVYKNAPAGHGGTLDSAGFSTGTIGYLRQMTHEIDLRLNAKTP